MEMIKIESRCLNEHYYQIVHPSGLRVLLLPKPGSVSTYAIFGTDFGSIDDHFRLPDEPSFTQVPAGIAHFLEHKLFESEEGDAFSRYAETGASANAYTSFDKTCYLFSCTDRLYESLDILLDFVQAPYFTQETVEKEQGIIGQEIKMYEDDPEWRVEFNLLAAMYHNHPVRVDIAGTVESIAEIDADLLYRCYHAFYNPANMGLCICGDIEPEALLAFIDKKIKNTAPTKVTRKTIQEPETTLKKITEQNLPVSIPLFRVGFKDRVPDTKNYVKQAAAGELLLELIFGKGMPFYKNLYKQGLINAGFSSAYFTGRGFSCSMIGGETHKPELLGELILKEIENIKKSGISEKDFSRIKNALYGKAVASYDSTENIGNNAISCLFKGIGVYDYVDAVAALTLKDAEQRLHEQFLPECYSFSIIHPLDKKEQDAV